MSIVRTLGGICLIALFVIIVGVGISFLKMNFNNYQQIKDMNNRLDSLRQIVNKIEAKQFEEYTRTYDFILLKKPNVDTSYARYLCDATCKFADMFPLISPPLLISVIWHESRFDTLAVSHKGAQGLMQLMPKTVTYIREYLRLPQREYQIFSVEDNLFIGCTYLQYLIAHYGQFSALSVYNSGYTPSRSSAGNRYAVQIQRYTIGNVFPRD